MSNQENNPATSNKNWTAPEYDKNGFNCPHCSTYSHHKWYYVYLYNAPVVISNIRLFLLQCHNTRLIDEHIKQILIELKKIHIKGEYNWNSKLSFCDKCGKYSIWVNRSLVYPDSSTAPLPIEEMPKSVKEIYNEARSIVNKSPRGACALLRLAVQTLIKELGEDESNLNKAIGKLVEKGLTKKVQEALDTVRVIGNNAVHPINTIVKDDTDNSKRATKLFNMLNFISEKMIADNKKISGFYNDSIPESKKEAINQRDKKG